ncbi:preprotein translocase subunit SecG [Ramlibacter sp. AW1]|uniref:Protein-export membrane protein SecG n=1 Tax=Ramlibacter aurantiacus TaxID=2801330 RepID=A0A936ZF84_9BURK|nr:preprotein translocase subunit SecG [Ramlibacter aurantiacus]MBL0419832.1 preprotein translocase subunit SecG [Ramlibacter aurantiacus]
MNFFFTAILTLQLLSALAMIGLILVQHGKGADMGAAFGSGGSGSLFGATGSANFLSRTTAVLATVFFLCTLGLAYFGGARPADSGSVLERRAVQQQPVQPAPAVPPTGANQIPGNTTPSQPPAAPTGVPSPAPTGAGQIPTR